MSSTTKVTARRDLIKYKYALRQRSKERDLRIEAAALDVLVQLGKRADAEQAAGHALELLHAEGLKTAEVAAWCGGLTAAEINRLRAVARSADTDADSPVGGTDTDADRADRPGRRHHPRHGRRQRRRRGRHGRRPRGRRHPAVGGDAMDTNRAPHTGRPPTRDARPHAGVRWPWTGRRSRETGGRSDAARPAPRATRRTAPSASARNLARCRRAWMLAHLTPALFSSMIWLFCLALNPALLLLVASVFIINALIANQPWVLRAMHGVRPASPGEREAMLRALVPVRALRGRGQPRFWIRTRPGPLQALTVRDVAVPATTASALLRGRLDPDQFAAAVVRTLAERSVCKGVAVHVGEVYCLPWTILAEIGTHVGWVGRQPLIHPLWVARPVVLTIAIVQQLEQGRPTVAATVLAITALTYLHPHWRTRWVTAVREYADSEVARQGLGTPAADA